MDISILLVLQDFRNGVGSCLTSFMSKMSFIGEMSTVLIFIALIYWCVSKDIGKYLMMGWCGNRVVNGLLKVTACAYRPWVRDPLVVPDAEAKSLATGYSFPSGHSMNAASLYGGLAIRKELPKVLRIMMAVIAVLIAFSRNFLGVHTPQDTIVGLVVGVLVMVLIGVLITWVDKKSGRDIIVMIVGILVAVAVAVFAAFKSYPVDYDEAGKLLVDGAKMANDTYKGVGWCVGFLVGWVLETRFVKFSTDVPMMTRVVRLVTGLFSYYVLSLILIPIIKGFLPGIVDTITACFLQTFFVTFVFPLCMKRFEKNGL